MSRGARYKFRLYAATDTPNSVQALRNLTALCQAQLRDRYEIEVVDVLKEPLRALADGIFMTPTLMVLAPEPIRRIVGTLGQTQTVLQVLGLEAAAS